jgi:hypothetical protein
MGLSNTSAGVDTVAPTAADEEDGGNKLGMEPDRWARKRGVVVV